MAAAALRRLLPALVALLHLQAAAGQSLGAGFLSLACGYVSGPPFTSTNQIQWQSDVNYVGTGAGFTGVRGGSFELQALRFFSSFQKNCYTLPLATVGAAYIVRAGFLYGNYDQMGKTPEFGLSLGATMWVDSVKLDTSSTPIYYEALFTARSSSIAVCLVRGGYGNPFINSLELRPLPLNSYTITASSSVNLYAVKRVNFGGPSLRYPKDMYDRMWSNWTVDFPDLVRQFSIVSANLPIVYTGSASDQPPQAVLQTAIRPSVPLLPISFTLPNPLLSGSSQSYAALYISVFSAELNASAVELPYLSFQCDSFSVNATRFESRLAVYRIGFDNQVFANASISCSLSRHKNSGVDPIISGLEVHAIQPISGGTYASDVTAMNSIKNTFHIVRWVGDPCLPVPWDGVTCSFDASPRVVGIVLAGGLPQLSTRMPKELGALTALTQLDLSDQGLFGPIPDALSDLRSLSILNLADNNLNGTFPLWLNTSNMPNLTQVFVQDNDFTGFFSDDLNNLGSNFIYYGGGNQLCSTVDTVCSGQSPSNPTPYYPRPSSPQSSSNKDRLAKIIGGVGGGLIVLLLLLAILVWYVSERKSAKPRTENVKPVSYRERLNLPNIGKYTGNLRKKDWKKAPLLRLSSNSGLLKTDGELVRRFRYDELKQATNKFKTKLLEDDLGVLFLGTLLRENKKVGVKVLSELALIPEDQSRSKIDLISKLRHPNVVPIVGFCLDGSRQILVYEMMDGGELHRLLHDPANSRVLSWRERLNVALGAAKGVDYLHNRFSPPVIHGDISSTSILLNDLFEAKIANAALKSTDPEISFLSGSGSVSSTQRLGYADPESLVIDQLTEKSDVYSFGVVLFEILCGRQPVSKFPPYDTHMQLVDWVKQSLNGGKVNDIVDSKMRIDYNEQSLSKYTALALRCVESDATQRPSMDFVVRELEETIQLQ